MRKIVASILLIVICFISSCNTTRTQITNDGSTIEKAIKVKSVEEEYVFVRQKCSDCKMKSQGLTTDGKGRDFDVLTFIKPNGEEVKYYFDISKIRYDF